MVADEEDDVPGWKDEDPGSHEDFENEKTYSDEEWSGDMETQNDVNSGETSNKHELESFPPNDINKSSRRNKSNKIELEKFSPININERFDSKRIKNAIKPGEFLTVSIGFGQTLKRMTREAWESKRPYSRQAIVTPISKVRFTHTGTATCNTTEECMKSCQQIQKYYMDLGFSDIPYNFLIGGDGVVYHGRGWTRQADRPIKYINLKRTCVDVAYIGNFENERVPYPMISTALDFLKYGLKIGKITPFYQAFSFAGEKHM